MKQDGTSIAASASAAASDAQQQGVAGLLIHHPERASTTDNNNPSAAVVPLLHSLTSKDNSARNLAEQAFNELKDSHPEALIYGLLEVHFGY